MAFITDTDGNRRWAYYDERAQLIAEYKEEQRLLTELMQTDNAIEADLDRLEDVTNEIQRLERIHRGEYDVRYFGVQYFSEDANPGNPDNPLPSGTNYDNVVDFHRELCNMFDDIAEGRKSRNVSYAVPRGHAKTTWISNIFLAHQLVYRHRKFIVLISETAESASSFTNWVRYQLKLNEKLRTDFGELLHGNSNKNEADNKAEFITTSRAKVKALGLGGQIRGLRHGATRPDLTILDDMESDASTNTQEQIEDSKQWFRESMLPSLSKDGICVYLGTILCYGSLLHHVVSDRKDFESRIYSAITHYSNRDDLWSKWRALYREDSKDAVDKADAFYEEHKDEMLEGTGILWPGYWSYYELMKIKEENGSKAFSQEYENNPIDEERQIFKPEYFTFFSEDDLEGRNVKYYGGVDMAMGSEKGDYSAVVTIAKNEETGVMYVYDSFMKKVHPDALLEEAVRNTLEYQYNGIGVEAVAAQEIFADHLREALRDRGYPSNTRLHKIKNRSRKELRIESLLPDIQNGRLRFHENFRNSDEMEQFVMYPMANDDFLDACHMAYTTAKGGHAQVRTAKKSLR